MFKKTAAAVLAAAMIFAGGCAPAAEKKDTDSLQIVTTVFPIYDWIRILSEGTDSQVTMLMKNGTDLHNFQPSAQDIISIHDADLFVCIGGESDEWTDGVLREASGSLTSVRLMNADDVTLLEEEVKEGMTVSEEHEEEHEHEGEHETDEHVWLSLKNAVHYTAMLSDQLQSLDPDHADIYKKNADAYIEKLMALDMDYADVCENAENRTVIFCDRFPFAYLVKDYGLDYYAAFAGCSAETEASFETVVFLADKLKELQLKHVFTIENSSDSIARTVIETSGMNADILVLDSMQSVNTEMTDGGLTYLSVMEENLEVLKKGLN